MGDKEQDLLDAVDAKLFLIWFTLSNVDLVLNDVSQHLN